MDLFDPNQIISLLKLEPGTGVLQSLLLFMIWISSRGVKKEIIEMKLSLNDHIKADENKFVSIENRLVKG